jgi:hypothetical protein
MSPQELGETAGARCGNPPRVSSKILIHFLALPQKKGTRYTCLLTAAAAVEAAAAGMAALTNPIWIYGSDDDTLFRLIVLGTLELHK